MNTQKTQLKGLSESRFDSLIFLLRIAAIPLKMKKQKSIYSMYMVTVTVCSYSTLIGLSVDVYIHMDDLGRAMTTTRALFSIANVMWIFSYSR